MRKVSIILLFLFCVSCKDETDEVGFPLGETNWHLYFKNNSSFSFFAESDLYFKSDKTVYNYRSADTVSGTWKTKGNTVTIDFEDGNIYLGNIIHNDSIYGTLTASGNNGVWFALR